MKLKHEFGSANIPLLLTIVGLILVLSMIAGWATNVIWTFHQETTVNVILGILGCIVAPIGALHGIYTWF